jgi:hypothetical protein
VLRTADRDHWLGRIDCCKGDYTSVLEMDIGEQTERMGGGGVALGQLCVRDGYWGTDREVGRWG